MALSDEILFKFIQDTTETLGELSADSKNTLKYLEAVNVNQKSTATDLSTHRNDVNAHGRSSRAEVWVFMGKVLSIAVPLGALSLAIINAIRH